MYNFGFYAKYTKLNSISRPTVKYSDLGTSRVEKPFAHLSKFCKIIDSYKCSLRSVETKYFFEDYISHSILDNLLNIFIVDQQQINIFTVELG